MKNSAVQAFRSIASRIHPQLPLSEKESQRLLTALTSSFRHQLDQEHPDPTARRRSIDSPRPPPVTHSHLGSPVLQSSSTSTDSHLASILTNPLFGRPTTTSDTALFQLKDKSKHPVRLFEEYASKGIATIDVAKLCLHAFRKSLSNVSASDAREQTERMAAGARVLRWLWSSGTVHTQAFTEDRQFLDTLAYFLVAEGRESALWELMTTPIHASESALPVKEARKLNGYLLCSIVKTHLSDLRSSITAALNSFFHAAEVNEKTSAVSATTQIPLFPAGAYLTRSLVNNAIEVDPSPSYISLYDRFVESCPSWDRTSQERALYRVANLKLHHPASPSARDALYFVRLLKQSPSHPFLSPSTRAQKTDVFNFFFDTVRLLHKQGFADDAAWVMEFMQHKFSLDLIDHHETTETRPSHAKQPDAAEETSSHKDATILPEWRVAELG
ncbi:hypothetical protein MBLNU459_g7202t1 [Dothideomycetes sp. NU459]